MAVSPVGPGTPGREDLRAWLDTNPGSDGKPKRTPEETRKRYNERQAEVMRRRRKDPVIKAREKEALKARDVAYRRLAAAFPEDFLNLLNAERISRGMPRLVPRKKRTVTNTTLPATSKIKDTPLPQPKPRESVLDLKEETKGVDAKTCTHSRYPMKKFQYGKFCGNCGTMIK